MLSQQYKYTALHSQKNIVKEEDLEKEKTHFLCFTAYILVSEDTPKNTNPSLCMGLPKFERIAFFCHLHPTSSSKHVAFDVLCE